MSKLANVYAGALFELANETATQQEILNQSVTLREVFLQNPQFIKILSAPMVEKQEKETLLNSTLGKDINKNLLNCLKVMVQRNAALEIVLMLEEFEALYNQQNNIEKVVAITAVALSQEMHNQLTEKLQKVTGKTILLENRVDESCIGGVVLEMSDYQIDDTIAQKLALLKEQLKNINH